MEEIHRGPEAGGTGRQLQGGLTIDPKGRSYPASSRNLKPPALTGGVFTPCNLTRITSAVRHAFSQQAPNIDESRSRSPNSQGDPRRYSATPALICGFAPP